jgi:toxin-antitoxin system PIN domain toxin
MKLVDVNVLLYAVNGDCAQHLAARSWLEKLFSEDEPVALPWVVLLAFLRVATSGRVFTHPISPEQALAIVDGWLSLPHVRVLQAGAEHWRILKSLLAETGAGGNLTTDAHLAAMAIEHGCELCSTDTDFLRFPRLKWSNPLRTH